MATTTNYGWTTPDDTALVKDGASAIRSLGTSVDTTTKNLNPSTTLGDIEYRSSTANTNTRLGIGSTGQVLTVAGGVPSWATAAGGGANWSLLNTGGTSLSGSSTITVSGISSIDKILVLFQSASTGSAYAEIALRLNADTGSNYEQTGARINAKSGYNENIFGMENQNTGRFVLATNGDSGGSASSGYIFITGANSSGLKAVQAASGVSNSGGGSDSSAYHRAGVYLGTSVITSVSILSGSNFDSGTIYVYVSA